MSHFKCIYCHKSVSEEAMGTRNRNHCPFCLWSKHVDVVPGDRGANCNGEMEPIGLTFKQEGTDKYGKFIQGEIMLIHKCSVDDKFSINRIAGDDNPNQVLLVFNKSLELVEILSKSNVAYLTEADRAEVEKQLFGVKQIQKS